MISISKSVTVLLLLLSTLSSIHANTLSVKLKPTKRPINTLYKTFIQKELSINLRNQQNFQYTGTMVIGSENQAFNLLFDTASPWLCVLPSNSNNSQLGTKFNCLESKTCTKASKSPGHYQEGTYFSFSKNQNVQGVIAWDNLSFKDLNSTFNQSFLILNDQSADLIDSEFADGICGLSPKNDQGLRSLVHRLYDEGHIGQKIFSLYLNNNPEAYNEEDSEILFGGVNPQYYVDEFVNVSAKNFSYYWEVNLQSAYLTMQNKSVSIALQAKSAILDSGTSYISMTAQDFLKVTYALRINFGLSCHFNSDKSYSCACQNGDISNFPNLTFALDSQPLTIPPSLYLLIKENYCVLLIQGNLFDGKEKAEGDVNTSNESSMDDDMRSFVVLGTPFLRTYYTVFNSEKMTISFARASTIKRKVVTALEVLYLALGIFILIIFIVLVVCTVKIWTMRGKPSRRDKVTDSLTLERAGSEIPYSKMQT